MRITAVSVLAFVAALGCGPQAPPEKPFILTDVASLGFDAQFGRGTLVGQAPVNSLTIRNEGQADLSISEITKTGDPAFTFVLDGQCRTENMMRVCDPLSSVLPKVVKGKMSTFIQVTFTPTDRRQYRGELSIQSNADNISTLTIGMFGCGVKPGVDGGMDELPDAGCIPM